MSIMAQGDEIEIYTPKKDYVGLFLLCILGLIVFAGIMWAIRGIVLWYNGMNDLHENQGKQNALLQQILNELKSKK